LWTTEKEKEKEKEEKGEKEEKEDDVECLVWSCCNWLKT
jgi:hypothetical protein